MALNGSLQLADATYPRSATPEISAMHSVGNDLLSPTLRLISSSECLHHEDDIAPEYDCRTGKFPSSSLGEYTTFVTVDLALVCGYLNWLRMLGDHTHLSKSNSNKPQIVIENTKNTIDMKVTSSV